MLVMVKMRAQSASRALGLLIAKDKELGVMPYKCFSKCYDAIVQSTLNYGAPIYGTSAFSCNDAVQNRACKYFLGLGKYAPNTAINGDMGWSMPQQRQWICVIKRWCKLTNMNNTLLTKSIRHTLKWQVADVRLGFIELDNYLYLLTMHMLVRKC